MLFEINFTTRSDLVVKFNLFNRNFANLILFLTTLGKSAFRWSSWLLPKKVGVLEYSAFRTRYFRNRKHAPCSYRVIKRRVEVWEKEKCCGHTSRRRVFPQLFRGLPNFQECFYNSIETRRTCFLFLLKNTAKKKKGKQLVNLNYHNVNYLCSGHRYVDSSC